MQLFPKKYATEVFHYYSETNIDTLRAKMMEYFDEYGNLKKIFSGYMYGRFTSETAFEVVPKLRIGYTRNVAPTCLTGELIPNGKKTEVILMLSPVRFYVFFFASIILGFVGLYKYFETGNTVQLVVGLLLFVIPPFAMLKVVTYEKRKLLSSFVNTFDLYPKQNNW